MEDIDRLTTSEKAEIIRLVRQTMGGTHPTGERIVRYIREGHTNLARRALEESIEGLSMLIEDDEEGVDEIAEVAPDDTKAEDKADLDKYKMLLEAIKEES